MEMVSSFVLLVVVVVLSSLKWKMRWSSSEGEGVVPPGPWKLPLIGNIHNLIGSMPHRALHELALKYGELMHVQLGELSVVVVSSPEAAKQIMKTHDVKFASRPSILVAEIMSYNCTNIAFSPYGDYWKHIRRICTQELLSVKRVQSLRSLREEVFLDLAKWIASKSMEGSAFNLTEKLYSSTYALITTAALGKIRNEHNRLLPIIREGVIYAAGFDIAELYPSIKLLKRMSSMRRRLSVLHDEADKIVEEIIGAHKVANSGDEEEDLVDVLLKYQDNGVELPLTNDNIKSVIMDILTGGSETAATTMDWAMSEMLKNPEVMRKAQEEVRNVFDRKQEQCVDESCIHELVYLKAVIKETLRLHPPLPLSIPRKCMEACEINGYHIPVGTRILVNSWAINRHSNYWEQPHCFQPERFLDSQVDFRGNHFEFIPFGSGRRICPGISFGLATVELPLAILLYHFDWSLPAPDNNNLQHMDMQERFGATVSRLKNLNILPIIKRPLPTKIIHPSP